MKFRVSDKNLVSDEGMGIIILASIGGALMLADIVRKIKNAFKKDDPIDLKVRSAAVYCEDGICQYVERDRLFPFSYSDYGLSDTSANGQKTGSTKCNSRYVSSGTYVKFITRLRRFIDGVASASSNISGFSNKIRTLETQLFPKLGSTSGTEIIVNSDGVTVDKIYLKTEPAATWPNCEWYDVDSGADVKVNTAFRTLVPGLNRIADNLEKVPKDLDKVVDKELAKDYMNLVRASTFIVNMINWLDMDVDWYNLGRLCSGIKLFFENIEESTWDYPCPAPGDKTASHYI